MNKPFVLLIASMLICPGLALAAHEPVKANPPVRASVHKLHRARPVATVKHSAPGTPAKTPVAASSYFRQNDPDYPWVLPA